MGSEWKWSTLGDTCYITDGAHAKVERQNDGVLYLTSKNFTVGSLKLDNIDFISEEDFTRLFTDTKKSQRRLRDGDVLTGIIGTFGNAYRYTSKDCFGISSSVAILRPNQKVLDSDYLYYVITSQSFKATVAAFKGGSVQGYTNIATLKVLPIPLPEISVQKHIVTQLKALDNKIQLNRETNKTLEAMAQALFKSWFVDFDPVFDNAIAHNLAHNNAPLHNIPEPLLPHAQRRLNVHNEGQNNADNVERGSARQVSAARAFHHLFPQAFEQSDEPSVGIQGWMPKGWGVRVLYDLAKFINGAAYKKFDPNTKGVGLPIIKIAELKSGVTEKTGFSTVEMPDKYLIRNKDILFSWSGNPDTSIDTFVWPDSDAWLNQHIFRVLPEKGMTYSYLLGQLRNLKPIFTEIARDKQTTGLGHVTVKNLKELCLAIPDKEVLVKASELLDSIYDRAFECAVSNKELTKLRDTLLPKLISGELRIPDAEQASEALAK